MESGYGDTSREGNEIGVLEPTRSGDHVACMQSKFHVYSYQFTLHSHPISRDFSPTRSQTGLARHVRTQKKQYMHIIKCGARSGSPQLHSSTMTGCIYCTCILKSNCYASVVSNLMYGSFAHYNLHVSFSNFCIS